MSPAPAVAGERRRGVAWIRRAPDEAIRQLAYEEAARLYRLALNVAAHEIDDAERCRLPLALGDALRLAQQGPGELEVCQGRRACPGGSAARTCSPRQP